MKVEYPMDMMTATGRALILILVIIIISALMQMGIILDNPPDDIKTDTIEQPQ